eukprot:Opistho-2@79828
MDLIAAVAQAALFSVRRAGLVQHGLADLAIQPIGTTFIQVATGRDILGLDKLDRHAFRHNRRAVARDVGDGTKQRGLVLVARAGLEFADAHRLAIGLGKDRPVALSEGLEHPAPRGDARQPGADRQARLGLDRMTDELERGQRAVGAGAIFAAAQQGRAAVNAIIGEPARIAPFQASGLPLAHAGVPDDFGEAVALADAVENIEGFVCQFVPVDPLADAIGNLDVPCILTGGIDRHVDLRDRTLARADDAQIMRVALLDLLSQFEIGQWIAHVGGTQNVGQANRVQSIGGIAAIRGPNAADRRRGDVSGHHLFAKGLAPKIDQHGHAHVLCVD